MPLRTDERPRIGVLALQGAFAAHRRHVEAAGGVFVEVTMPDALASVDGLILPGGESGVMLRLIAARGLEPALASFVRERPVWGICAGAILLARDVTAPAQRSFDALDIGIVRNAYGRQLDSRALAVAGAPVAFIRAPRIVRLGAGTRVLATVDGDPVWVESAPDSTVTTFHPELADAVPSPWHRALVERCLGRSRPTRL
jgi:5'-phosphate synthase pdxT subunit